MDWGLVRCELLLHTQKPQDNLWIYLEPYQEKCLQKMDK